jgi:hypothetical protein
MRHLALLCALIALVGSSCEKLVPVPTAGAKEAPPDGKTTYRLTTRDERIYEFRRFEATDSTFVILEVTACGRGPAHCDPAGIKTPLIIPRRSVATLERIERDYPVGILVAGVIGAVLVGIVMFSEFDFY